MGIPEVGVRRRGMRMPQSQEAPEVPCMPCYQTGRNGGPGKAHATTARGSDGIKFTFSIKRKDLLKRNGLFVRLLHAGWALSGWAPTCTSLHSWRLYSVVPVRDQATGTMT